MHDTPEPDTTLATLIAAARTTGAAIESARVAAEMAQDTLATARKAHEDAEQAVWDYVDALMDGAQ